MVRKNFLVDQICFPGHFSKKANWVSHFNSVSKNKIQYHFFFKGVSTTEGEPWEAQRNFLHDYIQNLVAGKGSQGFHDLVMDEVSDMKTELSKKVRV